MHSTRGLSGDDVLRGAVVLTLPVIGFEQILHTTPVALAAFPLYEAMHWLSDSLLALPLAAAALFAGVLIAHRLGNRSDSLPDILVRGAATALVFALLLVPGAALHEEADRLTHAHASLAIHTHGAADPRTAGTPVPDLGFFGHALSDGLEGQMLGLPLAVLMLWASARARRRTAGGGQMERGKVASDAPASGVITQLGGERRS